ncbi:MAG: Lrp/AsnC ligand binding domain-containing protein [Candidatus Heimdallarchaeota archaeon]|nr:Lrp/AsnC ligand binding domain-containing protein [Candidatus Heimdallarchaeota archaeon]
MIAYIFINCYADLEYQLAKYLRDQSIVEEVMITTGENDIIIRLFIQDLQELYEFTVNILENRPEIRDMRTSVVTKEINN